MIAFHWYISFQFLIYLCFDIVIDIISLLASKVVHSESEVM